GKFTELIPGDIAKKHDTGGVFQVEDLETEQKRFDAKEISFTAPMFGYKMREATGQSGEFESSILDSVTITKDDFRKHHIKGTRRMGIILPEITLDTSDDGLVVSFTLMKGSYATTVLREFMKNDVYAD
ncbi:MAG: tRNA pseudouridine(13) synthase TruD, partial [Candidatus Bathyarchaeota archaeon]|nr:tRNA pseudouridine(13) synthase TruD [Candidatus Bathyarchaeota archaeon]